MIDVSPYQFELHDGWPPDGEPGVFYGFDADMNCALLLWVKGNWRGVRWLHGDFKESGQPYSAPEAFMRADDTADRVVQWARAPIRWSALTSTLGKDEQT